MFEIIKLNGLIKTHTAKIYYTKAFVMFIISTYSLYLIAYNSA